MMETHVLMIRIVLQGLVLIVTVHSVLIMNMDCSAMVHHVKMIVTV